MNNISILIVLMGSLGDVVRGLAVVKDLASHYPNCKISWLVEPACEDLVRAHPGVNEVIVFERSKGMRAVWKLARALNSHQFDVCLDLQRHFKSGFFSYLSGAPRRIGFHRKDSKEGNWLFQTEAIAAQPASLSKLEHYRKFPEKLGATLSAHPQFGLIPGQLNNQGIENFINKTSQYLVAVLGSSWDSKDWNIEGYRDLLKELLETTSISVALVGTKTQTAFAEELSKFNAQRIVNFVGKTSLLELCALLGKCRVAFGPDSGPGHLAAALGKPYVSLFGPTDPLRTAPFKSEGLVVQSKIGCSPCYLRRCPGLGKLCMRLIHPAIVREKLLPLLQT